MASRFANAASELARHTEAGGNRDDDEDSWIVARDNESVDSFLTNCPPSFMEKAWISAQHDGMTKLVEDYYKEVMGAVEGEAYGRDAVAEITAAWEEAETKSLETLTALLKQYKHGGGKWMLFVPASDVDAIWRKVVTALWDGKLGHSAKVSGNTPESNGSHVINVYVDPFWETAEVERVLAALREICGITDSIKYKADGVSNLGIFKGNEHGIPPSFYAASRNSSKLQTQKASGGAKEWKEKDGGDKEGGDNSWGGGGESARGGLHASSRDNKWSARGNTFTKREERRPRVVEKKEEKPKKKAASAFAALSGADGDDAEAIMERKKKKLERKRRKAAEAAAAAAEGAAEEIEKLKAGLGKADWGDMEDEDEEEALAKELEALSSGSSSEESSEEEEEAEEAAPVAAVDVSEAVPAKAAPVKEKTKEELEMDALLASLESKDEPKDGSGAGGMSKAAAKRAKKKAAAAAGGEAAAAPAAEPAAGEEAAPKSAEEIKKMMAAKAAAAKAGKKKNNSAAEATAAALKAAKAREANAPKTKGPKTWDSHGGKQVGQKARGSDNKYQGE